MVGDTRQGWAVLAAMTVIFVVAAGRLRAWPSSDGNPSSPSWASTRPASALQAGGNMEGKEVRFGIANSALWATATTAASNGSVNAMHDSFTPLGGLVPMWLMQLGEVIYGGVGSGLYGMLSSPSSRSSSPGLMVGRTPEYLGKKIEAYEMKMASLVILIPPALVLVGDGARRWSTPAGKAGIANPGAHGFSEVLYAFSSAGNNNGSAFAGLRRQHAVLQHGARPGDAVRALLAGHPGPGDRRARWRGRRSCRPAPGTLPTHTPLFVVLLVGVVILVGALTFIPALALGPIVEHLMHDRRRSEDQTP